MRQAFNAREGIKPDQFKMPKRLLEPLTVGPGTGQRVDFETLRRCYFEAMGWDAKTGMPGGQVLADLGLDNIEI